jgi:hypothetical protein
MTEAPKKSNRRRRRRPRRRTKANKKATTATDTQNASSSSEPPPATDKPRRSRSKRRRKPQKSGNDLVMQRYDKASLDVSPINKDIFIYTHTLRPNRLLDNYQVGPSVVENMEFEDADPTKHQIS